MTSRVARQVRGTFLVPSINRYAVSGSVKLPVYSARPFSPFSVYPVAFRVPYAELPSLGLSGLDFSLKSIVKSITSVPKKLVKNVKQIISKPSRILTTLAGAAGGAGLLAVGAGSLLSSAGGLLATGAKTILPAAVTSQFLRRGAPSESTVSFVPQTITSGILPMGGAYGSLSPFSTFDASSVGGGGGYVPTSADQILYEKPGINPLLLLGGGLLAGAILFRR